MKKSMMFVLSFAISAIVSASVSAATLTITPTWSRTYTVASDGFTILADKGAPDSSTVAQPGDVLEFDVRMRLGGLDPGQNFCFMAFDVLVNGQKPGTNLSFPTPVHPFTPHNWASVLDIQAQINSSGMSAAPVPYQTFPDTAIGVLQSWGAYRGSTANNTATAHFDLGNEDIGPSVEDLQFVYIGTTAAAANNRRYGEMVRPSAGRADQLSGVSASSTVAGTDATLLGSFFLQVPQNPTVSSFVAAVRGDNSPDNWGTWIGNFGGTSGVFTDQAPSDFIGGSVQVSVVPEPAAFPLTAFAGFCLVVVVAKTRRTLLTRRPFAILYGAGLAAIASAPASAATLTVTPAWSRTYTVASDGMGGTIMTDKGAPDSSTVAQPGDVVEFDVRVRVNGLAAGENLADLAFEVKVNGLKAGANPSIPAPVHPFTLHNWASVGDIQTQIDGAGGDLSVAPVPYRTFPDTASGVLQSWGLYRGSTTNTFASAHFDVASKDGSAGQDLQGIVYGTTGAQANNRRYGEIVRPGAGRADQLSGVSASSTQAGTDPTLLGSFFLQIPVITVLPSYTVAINGLEWYTYVNNSNGTATFSVGQPLSAFSSGNVQVSAVPEPAALPVMAVAGLGLLLARFARSRCSGKRL